MNGTTSWATISFSEGSMESANPSGIAVPPLVPPLESAPIISRFPGVAWALVCYSLGWIAGRTLWISSWLQADFYSPPTSHGLIFDFGANLRWIVVVLSASALAIAGAACVVVGIIFITSKRRQGRSRIFCALLGFTLASGSMIIGDLVSLCLSTNSSPPAWTYSAWFWLCIYAAPGIAASPLIIRDRSKPIKRFGKYVALAALATTCLIVCVGYAQFAESIYQRRTVNLLLGEQPDFQRIADWVQAKFPARSVDSDFQLPHGISMPPGGHRIQAILIPKGPVLILITFYQEISLSNGGPAVVYITAPLRPDQVGHDSQGQPSIRIKGIWDHHIERQISSQIYLVELNRDPNQ